MKSNIIFLDEKPALLDEEIPQYFVENFEKLSKLLLALKKIRPVFYIHLNTPFFQMKISENITLQEIPKELMHQLKEEMRSLKLQLQKNPYSINNEDKIDLYWGIDAKHNNVSYESLVWTYLLDSMVISFKNNIQKWNSHMIDVSLFDMNNGDSEVEQNINIRHANEVNHINSHIDWIIEHETIPSLQEFLDNPINFLSNINLLNEAKDNLRTLEAYYPIIYNSLSKVNIDIIKWDEKSELVFSIKNAKGEGQTRTEILKKLGYEGYESHFYFTGIAGRIHYKIVNKIIEIKYIGKKIGV